MELLDIDDTVRELIYEGTVTQLHFYFREISFIPFRYAAVEKVQTGVTTVEEVLRVIPKSALYKKSSDQQDSGKKDSVRMEFGLLNRKSKFKTAEPPQK